ncbi:ATP synthase subunit alpha [Gossypium arboreum]|uniref:ATP synthase subunit alpha n=1 Tax=Gossypium arboreum TaxID=29729 RepID=A0A0B0MP78_GOSAR|nr:ATP synthase subunit alpha [Gossypium arboreum]
MENENRIALRIVEKSPIFYNDQVIILSARSTGFFDWIDFPEIKQYLTLWEPERQGEYRLEYGKKEFY